MTLPEKTFTTKMSKLDDFLLSVFLAVFLIFRTHHVYFLLQLEEDLRRQEAQISQMGYEKSQLEEVSV